MPRKPQTTNRDPSVHGAEAETQDSLSHRLHASEKDTVLPAGILLSWGPLFVFQASSLISNLHSLNPSFLICSLEMATHSDEVKSLSRVQLFATPWTVAYQAPPPMGFSRQEYWSGLPFPSPGDLPDPGIKPRFPALEADALTSEPPGKPHSDKRPLRRSVNRTVHI